LGKYLLEKEKVKIPVQKVQAARTDLKLYVS